MHKTRPPRSKRRRPLLAGLLLQPAHLNTLAFGKACAVSQGRRMPSTRRSFAFRNNGQCPCRLTMCKTHSITLCPSLSSALAQIFRVLICSSVEHFGALRGQSRTSPAVGAFRRKNTFLPGSPALAELVSFGSNSPAIGLALSLQGFLRPER